MLVYRFRPLRGYRFFKYQNETPYKFPPCFRPLRGYRFFK
ncbi:hypothetical protein GCWU000341_02215 [Oribacterium sp. oral taxon 078 str. F0262]|nr:hypothetical protein GCWU000341_02215 [Oribacterium sp. oral taxon 078 str. F0262]